MESRQDGGADLAGGIKPDKDTTSTHDVGFEIFTSFGKPPRRTREQMHLANYQQRCRPPYRLFAPAAKLPAARHDYPVGRQGRRRGVRLPLSVRRVDGHRSPWARGGVRESAKRLFGDLDRCRSLLRLRQRHPEVGGAVFATRRMPSRLAALGSGRGPRHLSPLCCDEHAPPPHPSLACGSGHAQAGGASKSGADHGFCQRQFLLRASIGAGNFPPPFVV